MNDKEIIEFSVEKSKKAYADHHFRARKLESLQNDQTVRGKVKRALAKRALESNFKKVKSDFNPNRPLVRNVQLAAQQENKEHAESQRLKEFNAATHAMYVDLSNNLIAAKTEQGYDNLTAEDKIDFMYRFLSQDRAASELPYVTHDDERKCVQINGHSAEKTYLVSVSQWSETIQPAVFQIFGKDSDQGASIKFFARNDSDRMYDISDMDEALCLMYGKPSKDGRSRNEMALSYTVKETPKKSPGLYGPDVSSRYTVIAAGDNVSAICERDFSGDFPGMRTFDIKSGRKLSRLFGRYEYLDESITTSLFESIDSIPFGFR